MAKWLANKLTSVLKRKKVPDAETLVKLLDPADPRTAIRPLGDDWLCPISCMRVKAPAWDGAAESLLEHMEIVDHLINLPVVQEKGAAAPMLSWEQLVAYTVDFRIRHSPYYRLCSDKGLWICPHCLMITDVLLQQWDGSLAPANWFAPQAHTHLNACGAFIANRLTPQPPDVVLSSQGERGIRMELMKRVAQDPVFRVTDDLGTWICPFTQFPVPSINLARMPWGQSAQTTIVEYLLSPQCPARYSNYVPSVALSDLQRAAGRISASHSHKSAMNQAEEEMQRLRSHVDELGRVVATAEEMSADLEAARNVQLGMLPSSPPSLPGYEIASFYDPCVQLGGDMYQFFDVKPGYTGLLVGDVSGHGVAAAVIMAMASKAFGMRSAGKLSPASVMNAVYTDLARDLPRGSFVTAYYAVLEHATGKLTCARAGHPPAYIITPDSKVLPLEGNGLAVGLGGPELFEKKLEERTVILPPGGTLVLYTDGIPEAMDFEKNEFTEERLQSVLSTCAGLSAQDTSLSVLSGVREHAGDCPMEDDLTLVVVRRLPH